MEGRREVSEALFGQIRRELRLGAGTLAAWVVAKEARLYLHRGDLDEARNLLEGPGATADACSCGLVAAERSATQGWLAWEQGRLQEACAHLASAGSDNVIKTYATMLAGPARRPRRSWGSRRSIWAMTGSWRRRWRRPGSGWTRRRSGR